MEDFLKEIGISQKPVKSDSRTYVIDIPDSNEYGRIYSKLDRSDLVDEDPESSQITSTVSSIQFIGEDYILTLLADFDSDKYKLTIREN